MYLLDTNVISETRKPRPHRAVESWLRSVADKDLRVSAVTLGEIQAGIEIAREQDPAKAAQIEAWADRIADTYNVLPMDARAFRIWAKLMHRRSKAVNEDAMIAATALAHELTVVTRNAQDFRDFGVTILDPFKN